MSFEKLVKWWYTKPNIAMLVMVVKWRYWSDDILTQILPFQLNDRT